MNNFPGFPHDYESKIGDWDLKMDYNTDAYTVSLDLESYTQNMLRQMRDVEEGAATEALIQLLRERGYTVIRPGEVEA